MPESLLRKTIRTWNELMGRLLPIAQRRWFYPAALLVIGVITYLYPLPSLGYFWDDWEVVFLLHAQDAKLFADYFAFDRPFAWPYQVMYAIFGLSPIAWHIVTLLLRWAGIVLLVSTISTLWPRQKPYLHWVGVLLLVYPGYLQQSISAAYNRHFAGFFLFSLSIYLMIAAIRRGRQGWPYMIAAWATAFIHAFTIEYFVGLELIRPLLLWLALPAASRNRTGTRNRQTALLWLPFAAVLGFYFWWRLAVFPTTIPIANYAGDFKFLQDFEGSVVSGALSILTRAAVDLLYGTLGVWTSRLGDPDAWTFQGKITWFAFALAVILAGAFATFHGLEGESEKRASRVRAWTGMPVSLAIFGLWAFLVGSLPIWLTSKQLSTQGRWDDRFALAPMIGACIVAIFLIATFIKREAQRALLTVLLALAIATQVLVVNKYRLEWITQNSYYWQLHWRAPALEPNTAIISFEQPSASIPGYDASFAMNILFEGTQVNGQVPHWFFTNDRFLNFDLVPDKPISYKDRNLKFNGNTSEAVAIVHQGENRCLQVLDSVYASQPFYSQNQEQLVAISNTSRIEVPRASTVPDAEVFGREPAHTWCYYFQKADLARQLGNWEEILTLEQQAKAHGYAAGFGPELVPFIEAHARLGDWEQALELSIKAQSLVSEMDPLLCATWRRLAAASNPDPATVSKAFAQFGCGSSE